MPRSRRGRQQPRGLGSSPGPFPLRCRNPLLHQLFLLVAPPPPPRYLGPGTIQGVPLGQDVLEQPYIVGGGGYPPPPRTPLLPFQCLRLTAKILLRHLRCQEDSSFKIFGPPSARTLGGPKEEGGVPAKPPPPLPIHPCSWVALSISREVEETQGAGTFPRSNPCTAPEPWNGSPPPPPPTAQ